MLKVGEEEGVDCVLNKMEHTEYRRVVGELLWLQTTTRPDIGYKVMELSTKLQERTIRDMIKANKIIKRVKKENVYLKYVPLDYNNLEFHVWCDASFARGDLQTSCGGMICTLSDGILSVPILWRSNKIRRVVRSTLAGETITCADSVDRIFPVQQISKSLLQ